MTSTWLPVVGERIRPVTTAAEAVSPGGDPIPAPGEGPHWARLRWPPPSDGDDRREAMVSDAERTATLDPESMESGDRRSVSVVWEDGGEDDGLDPATFGPCVDRSTPGMADEDPDARARAFAADARARGASRFRAGDDAAAAAEYVEACAMLASTLPAHALPAMEGGWNVPGYPTPTDGGGGVAHTMRINSSATGAASSAASSAAPPTVGTRVRVTSADGSSRAGMVAYVEEEEGVCDVMFDEANDGEDDEEVGVPFSRLFGYDPSPGTDAAFDATNEDADEDDDARRQMRREAAAAAARDRDAVCDELASRLLDVARCHLRLARGGYIATERIVGKDGKRRDAWVPARVDAASARACVSACDAALLMRRTRAGYYLRGKARTQLCQFRGAEDDLRTALATRETSVGGESNPVGDVASEREVKLALRALKAAARHRRASDRKLASAVVSNAYKARVDFGLDPGSELERTGRVPGGPYLRPAHERKHDAVDVRSLGDAIKERVAERVKRGCVLM